MTALKIGALAKATATNAPTIRYYEEIGIMPEARRSGAHRFYDESDVKRLTFIRRCREFGFSIDDVRALVALSTDTRRNCMEARDLAQEHLAQVRAKLQELRTLERSIAVFVESCDSRCAGGPGPECVIFEDLAASRAPAKDASRRKPADAQNRTRLRRRSSR